MEPLDPDLARETYLDAWEAAGFARHVAVGGELAEVSRAARALPEHTTSASCRPSLTAYAAGSREAAPPPWYFGTPSAKSRARTSPQQKCSAEDRQDRAARARESTKAGALWRGMSSSPGASGALGQLSVPAARTARTPPCRGVTSRPRVVIPVSNGVGEATEARISTSTTGSAGPAVLPRQPGRCFRADRGYRRAGAAGGKVAWRVRSLARSTCVKGLKFAARSRKTPDDSEHRRGLSASLLPLPELNVAADHRVRTCGMTEPVWRIGPAAVPTGRWAPRIVSGLLLAVRVAASPSTRAVDLALAGPECDSCSPVHTI